MRLISAGLILGLSAGLAQAKELTPREIYEQTSPAVVMVMGHPESGKSGSGGTGSIIQADGLVLTNAHVVIEEKTGKPYPRLSVFLKPSRVTGDTKVDLSRMAKARVLAYSPPLDLALLKLDGVRGPFPVIDLSDSERTRIGDRVIAIGHPEQGGLWTLTTGVISAEVDNFNGVKGKHVFQTETGLNRGNSGGPLVDSEGRMVGVNTAIARVAPDGLPITSISFSLKSTVARQWLSEQGVGGTTPAAQAASSSTKAATETAPPVSAAPSASAPQSTTLPNPGTMTGPSVKPAQIEPPMPARPYNLDQLLSERSKAEADLENMITEMRGRTRGQ
jgi:serine protease Do